MNAKYLILSGMLTVCTLAGAQAASPNNTNHTVKMASNTSRSVTHKMFLKGVTEENKAQIIEAAKAAGAEKISLTVSSGLLEYSGKNVKKDVLMSKIVADVPGVTHK